MPSCNRSPARCSKTPHATPARRGWKRWCNSVGPALCLEVARPGERPSRYRLLGDTAAARVRHECFFADTGETRRLEAAPASVNETVLDTRLAAFFREAFGLSLDYTAERRQAGFW